MLVVQIQVQALCAGVKGFLFLIDSDQSHLSLSLQKPMIVFGCIFKIPACL